MASNEPAPVIRTTLDSRYDSIERIERIGSDTRYVRGLGDIGTVVDLMDCSSIGGCPRCGEDELLVSQDIAPESVNALFYCTNPKCPYFVQDAVEHDMDKIRADKPHVWDNSAECPECDRRHVVEVSRRSLIVSCNGDVSSKDTEVTRGSHLHERADAGSSCIVDVLCDDCKPDPAEERERRTMS